MSSENIGENVDKFVDAFNNHDIDRLMRAYADDCVLMDPAILELHGITAIRGYYATLFEAVPDAEIELNNVLTSDRLVATQFMLRGTHKGVLGPPLDFRPSNKKFALPGACFCLVSNGKIVAQTNYMDIGGLLEQIGIQVERKAA